jgi:diketogulonate reductase-like aldo/keto reductase
MRVPNAVAIPKTVNKTRLEENLIAKDLALETGILAKLDRAFPPPKQKKPLMVI